MLVNDIKSLILLILSQHPPPTLLIHHENLSLDADDIFSPFSSCLFSYYYHHRRRHHHHKKCVSVAREFKSNCYAQKPLLLYFLVYLMALAM